MILFRVEAFYSPPVSGDEESPVEDLDEVTVWLGSLFEARELFGSYVGRGYFADLYQVEFDATDPAEIVRLLNGDPLRSRTEKPLATSVAGPPEASVRIAGA